MPISIDLPEALIETVALRAADIVEERLASNGRRSEIPRWVNAKGAAAYLVFSESKLRKLTSRNQIPHHHHDGRVHYRTDELDDWLSSR